MTIPKREGEFESSPLRRPAGPGEPEEPTDTGAVSIGGRRWTSRFPGWETYEGRPHEPRFEHGKDPTHDFRYNTNLNPSAVVPRHPGLVVYVLGAVLGFLMLTGMGLLLFYHFMQPARRSPQQPRGAAHKISTFIVAPVQPPRAFRPPQNAAQAGSAFEISRRSTP